MEYYIAESRRPLAKCLDDVSSCDLYIGIFAWRYGYIPPGQKKSITELEFRHAVKQGKTCLFFLLKNGAPWPTDRIEFEASDRITALRKEIQEKFLVSFFVSSDDIQARVLEAVIRWQGEASAVHVPPFQAPPLPPHYVERSEALSEIANTLLSTQSGESGVLMISAFHGLPGVGKTSLAAALAHQPATRGHFRDGVLWATLGQSPDCLSYLTEWIHALGDVDYRPTALEAASIHLRSLTYDKTLLLIVDDVWEAAHARPFLVGGTTCRLLVTTRRAHVADELGARLWNLDVMSLDEAIALLGRRVEEGRGGRPLSHQELDSAKALAQESGCLPMALELMGSLVARGYGWDEACSTLRAVQKDSRQNWIPAKLEATIQISLQWLRARDEIAWDCFVWLGVLPDDVVLTAPMAATLWGRSAADAKQLLAILADEAMIQRRAAEFRVHDLMHDMARRLLTAPRPKGLGLSMQEAHRSLLGRYENAIEAGKWYQLANDGYIHLRLLWHFEQIDDWAATRQLLDASTSDDRNAWYVAREELGQSAGFLEDVTVAWRLERKAAELSLARQCRYALIVSSIHSLAQFLSPKLLLILLEKGVLTAEQALDRARQFRGGAQRASTLMGFLPILGNSNEGLSIGNSAESRLRQSVVEEVRSIVRTGLRSPRGADLLIQLARHLEVEERDEVVKEALDLVESRQALDELVRKFPPSGWENLHAAVFGYYARFGVGRREVKRSLAEWGKSAREDGAMSAEEAEEQFNAILRKAWRAEFEDAIELMPYLSVPREEHLRRLLAAYFWVDTEEMGDVFVRLADLVPPDSRVRVAEDLIRDGRGAVGVTCLLANFLAEPRRTELRESALARLAALADPREREAAMAAIARCCPASFVRQALHSFQRIDDKTVAASLLFTLAPFLDSTPTTDLFGFLHDHDHGQIYLLSKMVVDLASAIKGGLLTDFVREAASFSSEWWVVEGLTLTILGIHEVGQFAAVRRAAVHITASDLRARLLGRVALRLARLGHLKEAIDTAAEAPSLLDRWRILSDVASDLAADGALGPAQEVSEHIEDAEEQSKAQAAIVLQLAARGRVDSAHGLVKRIRRASWKEMALEQLSTLTHGWQMAITEEAKSFSVPDEAGSLDWTSLCDALESVDPSGGFKELEMILSCARVHDDDGIRRNAEAFWRAKGEAGETFLERVSKQPRALLLKELRRLGSFLVLSLQSGEVEDLMSAIQDVETWWP